LNSIQKAWIAIGVGVALFLGLLFWQTKYNKPKDVITSLSREDVETLIKDFPRENLLQFAESKDERQKVLKQLKELLSLAAEARATGLANTPAMKSQLELQKSIVLTQAYIKKANEGGGANPDGFTKEEIDGFLKKPGTEEKFKSFLKELQDSGQMPAGEMPEAQLAQLKEQWARVYVGEEKAKKAGLDKERKTQLQIAIQQALVLARKYNEEKMEKDKDKFKVEDAEIDKWIADHPEFDPKAKRAKAEALLKRARSGEDFAKLANENTDDPGNKDQQTGELKGGFYEFGRGRMDKNFEDASFALQSGQVSELVETPYGYHIIKLEGKEKKKDKDGKEQEMVKVRHILISTMVKDENNPRGQELPLKEKARQEVERGKREAFINEIAKRNGITVPDDFSVDVPPAPPQQQTPQQMPQQQQGGEQPQPQPQQQPKKTEGKKPTETKPKPKTQKKGK
jgi:parvulin-like peptidyl-prolyl isomerase